METYPTFARPLKPQKNVYCPGSGSFGAEVPLDIYKTGTERPVLSFFLNKLINFWLCWVFVAVRGLSLVAASGGYSSLWCTGFSPRWLLLFWSTGSRCTGFSSCSTRAQ